MKLLLDTHTFLWFLDDNPQLSQKGKDLLEADNEQLLSIASRWEIAIKLRLGKLTVAVPIEMLMTQQLTQNDIELLPITVAPLIVLSTLPLHHRDPFDRLLIAQAKAEQMRLVSADSQFAPYLVDVLW